MSMIDLSNYNKAPKISWMKHALLVDKCSACTDLPGNVCNVNISLSIFFGRKVPSLNHLFIFILKDLYSFLPTFSSSWTPYCWAQETSPQAQPGVGSRRFFCREGMQPVEAKSSQSSAGDSPTLPPTLLPLSFEVNRVAWRSFMAPFIAYTGHSAIPAPENNRRGKIGRVPGPTKAVFSPGNIVPAGNLCGGNL